MLGVPAETEETIRATIALIQEIDPPFVTMAKYTPLPGTPMYQDVIQEGLLEESETDWTWAANQSLDRIFVKAIDPKRFIVLMKEATQFVEEHNAKHALEYSDPRMK